MCISSQFKTKIKRLQMLSKMSNGTRYELLTAIYQNQMFIIYDCQKYEVNHYHNKLTRLNRGRLYLTVSVLYPLSKVVIENY